MWNLCLVWMFLGIGCFWVEYFLCFGLNIFCFFLVGFLFDRLIEIFCVCFVVAFLF